MSFNDNSKLDTQNFESNETLSPNKASNPRFSFNFKKLREEHAQNRREKAFVSEDCNGLPKGKNKDRNIELDKKKPEKLHFKNNQKLESSTTCILTHSNDDYEQDESRSFTQTGDISFPNSRSHSTLKVENMEGIDESGQQIFQPLSSRRPQDFLENDEQIPFPSKSKPLKFPINLKRRGSPEENENYQNDKKYRDTNKKLENQLSFQKDRSESKETCRSMTPDVFERTQSSNSLSKNEVHDQTLKQNEINTNGNKDSKALLEKRNKFIHQRSNNQIDNSRQPMKHDQLKFPVDVTKRGREAPKVDNQLRNDTILQTKNAYDLEATNQHTNILTLPTGKQEKKENLASDDDEYDVGAKKHRNHSSKNLANRRKLKIGANNECEVLHDDQVESNQLDGKISNHIEKTKGTDDGQEDIPNEKISIAPLKQNSRKMQFNKLQPNTKNLSIVLPQLNINSDSSESDKETLKQNNGSQLEIIGASERIFSPHSSQSFITLEKSREKSRSFVNEIDQMNYSNILNFEKQNDEKINQISNMASDELKDATLDLLDDQFENIPLNFLLNLMQNSLDNLEVERKICKAIRKFSQSSSKKDGLIKSGVYNQIINVMNEFETDSEIQEHACWSILNICCDDNSYAEKLGKIGACEAVVKALLRFQNHRNVQQAACKAIRSLEPSPENQSRLMEAGVCEAVTTTLKNCDDDIDLIESTCKAIINLSMTKNLQRRLGKVGGCGTIVQIMEMFPKNQLIASCTLKAIRNLACHDKQNQQLFVENGACEAIVRVLRTFFNDRAIQENGCKAVYNLSTSADCQDRFGEVGACELIIRSLQAFPEDRKIAQFACSALQGLAHMNEENQRRFAEAGACEVLGGILQSCPEEASIQYQGCYAVYLLALNLPDARQRLGDVGACEAIVQALNFHTSSQSVTKYAIRAIYALSEDNDTNQQRLGDIGGCEAVIKGMKTFIDEIEIQMFGCMAIKSLAINHAENLKLFGIVGASQIVIRIMRHHSKEKRIQKNAIFALHELSSDPKQQQLLGRLGACECIIQAMESLQKFPDIQQLGCGIIKSLSEDFEENRARFGEAGACQVMIDILIKYFNDRDMLDSCLSCVVILALDDNNRRSLHDKGIAKLVSDIMKKFWYDKVVQESALLTIENLASKEVAYKEILENNGIFECIMKALKTFPHQEDIQEYGCWAIVSLARDNPGGQTGLANVGACEAIVRILQKHSVNESIQEAGCKAIRSLSLDNAENQRRFLEAGACEVLLRIGKTFFHDGGILFVALAAIRNLSQLEENLQLFVNLDLCNLVVQIIRHQMLRHDVVQSALIIAGSTCSNIENIEKLKNAGICECIVIILQTFGSMKEMLRLCCGLVIMLSMDESILKYLQRCGIYEAINQSQSILADDDDELAYFVEGTLSKIQI